MRSYVIRSYGELDGVVRYKELDGVVGYKELHGVIRSYRSTAFRCGVIGQMLLPA